jgi:hypothetical protein
MAPRQRMNLQTVPSRAETLCCAWHPLLATALPMAYAIALGLKRKVTECGRGALPATKNKRTQCDGGMRTPLDTSFGREGGWLEVQDVPSEEEKEAEECSYSLGMDRPTHMHTRTTLLGVLARQATNVNRHSVATRY